MNAWSNKEDSSNHTLPDWILAQIKSRIEALIEDGIDRKFIISEYWGLASQFAPVFAEQGVIRSDRVAEQINVKAG